MGQKLDGQKWRYICLSGKIFSEENFGPSSALFKEDRLETHDNEIYAKSYSACECLFL